MIQYVSSRLFERISRKLLYGLLLSLSDRLRPILIGVRFHPVGVSFRMVIDRLQSLWERFRTGI